MKNTVPKYMSSESKGKNRINLDNLFYLNVKSAVKSSNVKKDKLDLRVLEKVRETLQEEQYRELVRDAFGNEKKREKLRQEINLIINQFSQVEMSYLGDMKLSEVSNIIVEKIVGLDVLDELRRDPMITDISVDGYDNIRVDHIEKGKYRTNLKFDSPESYTELLNRFAFASGKSFSYNSPSFNAIFPQIRLNVVGFDISPKPTLQMRMISKDIRLSKEYMIGSGYINEIGYDFLRMSFPINSNLISGETGTGKTELLRYLVRYTKKEATIAMIEDIPESYLDEVYSPEKYHIKMWQNRDVVNGEDLEFGYNYHVKNAMRNNIDYILIQESRGGEAAEIVKAASTGHLVNTTLHAKSAFGSVNRMIDLCQEGKMQPEEIYGKRIVSQDGGFRTGTHLKRFGKVRRINEVVEFTGFENGRAIGNTLIKYNPMNGQHEILSKMSKQLWDELSEYHDDMKPLEALSPYINEKSRVKVKEEVTL